MEEDNGMQTPEESYEAPEEVLSSETNRTGVFRNCDIFSYTNQKYPEELGARPARSTTRTADKFLQVTGQGAWASFFSLIM